MPYSSARTAPPWIVVIHTGEGILSRADMARFLDNNSGASAHAAGDAGGVQAPLVPYSRAAWTAGYTGNNAGLHIELCAFAMLTRDQWLSESDVTIWVPWVNGNRTIRSPRSMLRHAAGWTRQMCDSFGIARRKVSAADLRAGRSGICGHADTSAAWGETDHTDPGTGFPWDVFISMVEGQEEDTMSAADAWNGFAGALEAATASVAAGKPDPIAQALQAFAWNGYASAMRAAAQSVADGAPDDIARALRVILPATVGGNVQIDYARLAAALGPQFADQVSTMTADKLAARLKD